MNREQKAAAIAEIAAQIKESEAVFAVDFRGISVPQAADVRTRLRDADATFRVVKNTLTERAADEAGAEALKPLLEGPTALTFVRGDAAMAAKAIATSKSVKPSCTRWARSSAPTMSAPASSASRALSPLANTATVISLPSPCGSEIVPRSCWSA